MHRSKLLRTLQVLSPQEVKDLQLYINSDLFVPDKLRKEFQPLFQLLLDHLNKIADNLEKRSVYQQLFPGEPIVKGRLEKLMSELLKVIHRYITFCISGEAFSRFDERLVLARFFRKRKAYDLYAIEINRLLRQPVEESILDKEDFLLQARVGEELYQFELLNPQKKGSDGLSRNSNNLDVFYLLSKLENICCMLSNDKFRQPLEIDKHIEFLQDAKPLYQKHGLLDLPLVGIYYKLFEMLMEEEQFESAYEELKKMIEEKGKDIPFDTLKMLSGLSRNFIIYRYNGGDKHLEAEVFELYKSQLQQGFLYWQTGLLPATFKNIVTMGLRRREYDWTYWFLNEYKDKIEGTAYALDVYHYNLATYFFRKKEYDNAMELLSDQYEDLFYKLSAKRLELKVYYETDSEILDSKMDAFKLYVFRLSDKKLLARKIKSNNNFINFLRQIRNSKTMNHPLRIEKLKNKIQGCRYLSEKQWLLEKLDALTH